MFLKKIFELLVRDYREIVLYCDNPKCRMPIREGPVLYDWMSGEIYCHEVCHEITKIVSLNEGK